MKEAFDLIDAWHGLPAGEAAILVTVVHTDGSTYRKPGAKMLLTRAGWLAGSVSGGCVESELETTAWHLTAGGSALATFDARSEADAVWGYGLGCNGLTEVFVERLPADGGVLGEIERALTRREPLVILTCLSEGKGLGKRWYLSEGPSKNQMSAAMEDPDTPSPGSQTHPPLPKKAFHFIGPSCNLSPEELQALGDEMRETGKNRAVDVAGVRYFIEYQPTLRRLVLFGAGHDAIPLGSLAKAMGWLVAVVDHREAFATQARFPGAGELFVCQPEEAARLANVRAGDAAVLMSHHYLHDRQILKDLLETGVEYIGVLGPGHRTDKMLAEIGAERSSRIHSPVGLKIGAEGPDEIALSILAQILATFKGKSPT